MSANLDKLASQLSQMHASELVTLIRKIETDWGVSATVVAPPVTTQPVMETAEAVEEQTTFSVVLEDFGVQKINIIKVIRQLLPKTNLQSAKSLVESAPVTIMEDLTKEDAEQAAKQLRDQGATVSIK